MRLRDAMYVQLPILDQSVNLRVGFTCFARSLNHHLF